MRNQSPRRRRRSKSTSFRRPRLHGDSGVLMDNPVLSGSTALPRRAFLRLCGAVSVLGAGLPPGCRKLRGQFVVGFSQMANVGAWRLAETNSLRQEAERRHPAYDLIVTDAQDSTAKQIGDVEDLVARRVHALLIAPRDYDGLEPALDAAARARI